jgi:PAS domain S-box-containing protein
LKEIVNQILTYLFIRDYRKYDTPEKIQLFYDRIYTIIGFTVTPLISFLFTDEFTYWELFVLQIIGGIYFIVFVLSFTRFVSPSFINNFNFIMFLICAFYAVYIDYLYKFHFDKVLGSLAVIFSILNVLQKKYQIITFYLFSLVSMSLFLYVFSYNDVFVNKNYFFFFYAVGLTIIFFNTRNKQKLINVYGYLGNILDKLFNEAPIGFILADANTLKIIRANSEAEKLFHKNLVGRYIDSITQIFLNKNEGFETEIKNNKGLSISLKAKKIYVNNQPYLFVIANDVTEQKELQELITLSRDTYLEIFQNSDDYYLILDTNGKILEINNKVTETFGYVLNQIEGKYTNIFVHSDDYDKDKMREILKSVNEGQKIKNTFWLKDKNNHKRLFEFLLKKIKYYNQEVILVKATDITDKHIILEDIKENKKRLEILAEHSINCIVFSQNGIITDVNKQTTELLGYTKYEMLSKTLFDFLHPEDVPRLKERLQLPEEQTPEFIDLRLLTKNGTVKYIRAKGKYIDIKGIKTRISIFIDITPVIESQQKELEAHLINLTNKSLKQEIEERKKTERKLLEFKDYMQNMIDSSINMIITTDINNNISEFNPAAEQTFKLSKREVIGKKIDILYADKKEFEKVLNTIQQQGYFKGEIQNRAADGRVFTSYLTATQIKNKKGEVVGYMGISRDISQEKESEEVLKDIFENTTNLIQSVDKNFNIGFVNKAWLDTLEYTEAEVTGKNLFNFIPEEEKERCLDIRKKVEENNIIQNIEIVFQSKSGRKIYTEGTLIAKKEHGKLQEVRGFFRDITVSRMIRKQLEQNEERYRAIFNQAFAGIALINNEGKIIKSNQKFASIFQEEIPDIERKNIKEYLPLSYLLLEQFNLSEKNKTYEIYIKEKEQYLLISNTLIINEEDKEMGILVVEDITQVKKAEQELRRLLKEKETLLKEVHHRVKNNLQVISSILNLQAGYITDKKTKEILEESQNRVRSMALVHEILYKTDDFSEIDFTTYINILTQNIQMTYYQNNQIILQKEIHIKTLPLDTAIPLGLIINELISNAYKHAFKNRERGLIQLFIEEKNNQVTVIVQDNGVGIDPHIDIQNLNSLGLQLVESLTQQLGAKMSIENNKGSKFTITFEKK